MKKTEAKSEKSTNNPLEAEAPEKGDSSIPLLPIDKSLRSPIRFNVMFLLYTYSKLGFTRLQKLMNITPGNLDHHLKKLVSMQWIEYGTKFTPRPLITYKITAEGKQKFKKYIVNLQNILQSLE